MRRSHVLLAIATLMVCAAGFSTPNEAEDLGCTNAISQDVRELYAEYAALLRRGDIEALTALYSPDAILMGPAAQSIRLGRAEIATYYTAFLQRRPNVVALERTVRTDCDTLSDAGIEVLSVQPDPTNARLTSLTTRYSLSYGRFGDRWLIVHHHQEIIDPRPSLDAPVASAPPLRLVTGANPPSSTVVVPPSPYELPASPPVILSGQPQLVPTRIVATSIDREAIERLVMLARVSLPAPDVSIGYGFAYVAPRHVPAMVAPAMVAPAKISAGINPPTVVIPKAAFGLDAAAPTIPLPPVDTPVAANTEPQLTVVASAHVAIVLPPTPFALPTTPPPIETSRIASAPSPISATTPAAAAKTSANPAVAGFSQRAAPQPATAAPRAVAPAAALPKPAAVAAKPAPKPSVKAAAKEPAAKSGKFLRWDEKVPIFDE